MATIDEPPYPIANLVDELKSEDIQLRLNSIRRLSTIARALGEESTRKELIPILSENNDNVDEVLLAMAEELGVFIPYVGGVEYAHVLLPPLETICTVEETRVRDKGVESLCRIGPQMKETDLVDWFIPLVKRLAAGEWFTARVSSCGLFHIAYPSANEPLKAELRSIYGELCQDNMTMVRRSAAANLGKFAATIEGNHLKTEIMTIFEDLTHDDQGSVRLLAVEHCAALGKLLDPQDCLAHILPAIVNFSQDKSSLVRCMVVHQLYELCDAVCPESTRAELVPIYVRLLLDNEAKVRIAAVGKVAKFCLILNSQLAIQHILPCVKELSSDSSQHVRSALASVIMGMTPVLGKEATIEQLLPIFLSLLKDEFPDVILNFIKNLNHVNQFQLLVHVQAVDKHFTVVCNNTNTVGALIAHIAKRSHDPNDELNGICHIMEGEFALVYDGHVLDTRHTFDECGITTGYFREVDLVNGRPLTLNIVCKIYDRPPYTFLLDAYCYWRISVLKERISESTGFPPDMHNLIYKNQCFNNDRANLWEYGIEPAIDNSQNPDKTHVHIQLDILGPSPAESLHDDEMGLKSAFDAGEDEDEEDSMGRRALYKIDEQHLIDGRGRNPSSLPESDISELNEIIRSVSNEERKRDIDCNERNISKKA